ncbi:MAG TPA: hypothetical protein VMY99_02835 [Nevskiaceae bacterium]|nr:hypothetical protein [Nevskiaceae bacterium]
MNRVLTHRWLVILLALLAGGTIITLVWYSAHASRPTFVPNTQHVLGTATVSRKSSDELAIILQTDIAQVFTQFDKSLSKGDINSAQTALAALQSYQRQILTLLPQLSADRKALLAGVCLEQINIFEADLHILPEQAQMDGMLVSAGYQAIMDNTK